MTLRALLPIAIAIVTFAPRYLPMAILTRLRLPGWLEGWSGSSPPPSSPRLPCKA